jgi:hypothetical protein
VVGSEAFVGLRASPEIVSPPRTSCGTLPESPPSRWRAANLTEAYRRALSPLYWTHVRLYGTFRLHMESRLGLDRGPVDERSVTETVP